MKPKCQEPGLRGNDLHMLPLKVGHLSRIRRPVRPAEQLVFALNVRLLSPRAMLPQPKGHRLTLWPPFIAACSGTEPLPGTCNSPKRT